MYRRRLIIILGMLCFGIYCNAQNNDGSPVEKKEEPIKFVIGDDIISPVSDIYDDWDCYRIHTNVRDIPNKYDIDLSNYFHPLQGKNNELLSSFGKRNGRFHYGVDIRASLNDTVYAAFDGKVRFASYNAGGYGFIVIIRHFNGLETYYAHLSRLMVMPNQFVCSGHPIGMAGSTGRASCVHLHFETRFCGKAINPQEFIDIKDGTVINENFEYIKK